MKQIKHFALALAVAAATNFSAPVSYAFMMQAEEATVGLVDITQTVDSIREEMKAGETACEDMLTKIDAAINSIDAALDKGIADEKKYLGLRDELVELRLELPCLGNELTQDPGTIISDTVISETPIGPVNEDDGRPVGAAFGGGAPMGGAAGGIGGGAGGGIAGGLGGIGPLALGGIAAAIAVPIAAGANDNPGNNASTN